MCLNQSIILIGLPWGLKFVCVCVFFPPPNKHPSNWLLLLWPSDSNHSTLFFRSFWFSLPLWQMIFMCKGAKYIAGKSFCWYSVFFYQPTWVPNQAITTYLAHKTIARLFMFCINTIISNLSAMVQPQKSPGTHHLHTWWILKWPKTGFIDLFNFDMYNYCSSNSQFLRELMINQIGRYEMIIFGSQTLDGHVIIMWYEGRKFIQLSFIYCWGKYSTSGKDSSMD